MNIQPISLQGKAIRLEPLKPEHGAGLSKVCDPDLLKYHFTLPNTWDEAGFEEYVQRLSSLPGYSSFVMILTETGQPVGTSSYLDIRPAHKGIEIGSTWIGREYQKTAVNPESKYLMLRHAFEDQGAIRVQLKTDARNIQSQKAIEKLGAIKEGVHRKHVIMPDGYLRDSVMYSITDDQWADIKARLEARLGYAL